MLQAHGLEVPENWKFLYLQCVWTWLDIEVHAML